MTITEYYDSYKTNRGKENIEFSYTIPDHSEHPDEKISDFFKNCISKNNLHEEQHLINNVKAWHEMLVKYSNRDDAVFWIRRYEGSSKEEKAANGGRWINRRGCRTDFNNTSYVFVSNFDVHEIFNMVRLGVEPDIDEFANLMKNYEFPMHYSDSNTSDESFAAAYPHLINPPTGVFSKKHWYLAHIIGIKSSPYYNNGDKILVDEKYPDLFSRGDLSEWKMHNGHKVRKINRDLNSEEKAIVKAHFLRFIDPLNYYIVPSEKYQISSVKNQIGEDSDLNAFMSNVIADAYGKTTLEEFRETVMATKDLPTYEDKAINIKYAPIRLRGKNAVKYSLDDKYKVAGFFMRNNVGLIKMENQLLGLMNKKGWVAKAILDSLGVENKRKGLLIKSDIDIEISKATGIFKHTLEEIKKRGLHMKN